MLRWDHMIFTQIHSAKTLSMNYDNMLLNVFFVAFALSRRRTNERINYWLINTALQKCDIRYFASTKRMREKKPGKFYMKYANTLTSNCFWPNVGRDNISHVSSIANIAEWDAIVLCYSNYPAIQMSCCCCFCSSFFHDCYLQLNWKTKEFRFIVVKVKIHWPLCYFVSIFNSRF